MPEGGELAAPPESPAEDLSAGALSVAEENRINLGLAEQSHRFQLQRTVANSALSIAVVFFFVAALYGGVLLYAIAIEAEEIHWHASILVAAFVVPPTLMVIALVRAVYSPAEKETDTGPALAFLKEVVSVVAAAFKKPGSH